jgi:hypothetical protein
MTAQYAQPPPWPWAAQWDTTICFIWLLNKLVVLLQYFFLTWGIGSRNCQTI